MTILKSSARKNAEELARHLLNTTQNESVRVMGGGGLIHQTGETEDVIHALEDFEMLAQAARGKLHIFHLSVSPAPQDEPWSQEDWIVMRRLIEQEYDLHGQPWISVEHHKAGEARDIPHRHFVYSLVQFKDDGTARLAPVNFNRVRNEKVARTFEVIRGKTITKGRHNTRIMNMIREDADDLSLPDSWRQHCHTLADRIEATGITQGERPTAVKTDKDWRQELRTGIKRKYIVAAAGAFWDQVLDGGDWETPLRMYDLKLYRGDSTVVIMDPTGGQHGLPNAISAALKLEGKPRVRRKQVEDVLEALDMELPPLPATGHTTSFGSEKATRRRKRQANSTSPRKPRRPSWTPKPPAQPMAEQHGVPCNIQGGDASCQQRLLDQKYCADFSPGAVTLISHVDFSAEVPMLNLYNGGWVRDEGARLMSQGADPHEAALIMFEMAKAKGWKVIEVTQGSDEFTEALEVLVEGEEEIEFQDVRDCLGKDADPVPLAPVDG